MNAAQIEAYVDAASALLELSLEAAHRAGVLRYFGLAADMAALVDAVPLEQHQEAAVHFTPISPRVTEGKS